MASDINYIIQKSLNGDKNYQEILLENLKPLLYKNIYMYWDSKDSITEDMLQEGYIVILQALKTYDNKCEVHFLQYVKIKIQYFFKNYYEKAKKQKIEMSLSEKIGQENFELENIIESSMDILENVIKKENSEELLVNLYKLNEKEQEIIYLYYFKHIPLVEISKHFNVPYSTLTGRKKTSINKLNALFRTGQ